MFAYSQMPSRGLAPLSGQGDGFVALHTQHDKESFALPVLVEAEDVVEPALDFQGRKHVDSSEEGDEVYVLQDDTSSSHTKFTMPGQATINALRDYLLENLQPHQIVDGYGNECKMFEISNDHLAVLQAKMWTKTSNGRSPIKATVSRPSRAQVLIAGHIAKISQLLEENRLFVLSETGHGTCDYMNCLQDIANGICHSKIVRIEPLVHWGTVTPATASQFMATFRRDGGLMQVPAYKQLVRQSIDADASTYCFDCLEYLWSKRAEAWDIMRRLEGAVPRLPAYSSNWAHRICNHQTSESSSYTIDASVRAVGETASTTAYQIKPVETETHDEVRIAPYQLDGTSDHLDVTHTRPHANDNQGHGAAREQSDSEVDVDEHCERMSSSSSRSNSFTLPLRTTPVTRKRFDNPLPLTGYRPSVQAPTSTVPQVNDITKACSHKKTASIANKYGFRVKVQTPPPRTTERKFGRELDTNSTIPPVQVRKSPRKHTEKASVSKENLPSASVRPIKPLKSLKKAKDLTKETKKRKSVLADPPTSKQKMARTAVSKEIVTAEPKLHINPTAGLEPQPVVRPPSPPKLVVHFAKRPMDMETPDGVATLTYEAFQNDHPAPTSKICLCHKPALHRSSKKGDPPQIAQCVSRDCRFRWYHYACLNQSEKGKARWGTFLCQHCRNEEEFAERDKRNGWIMAQQTDFRTDWTKDDVEAEMPGLAGHGPVANPYGLGLEIDLEPAFKTATQTKGMLGQLGSFGYMQSHPHMLVEAYTNADAYAQLRAEVAENEAWRF